MIEEFIQALSSKGIELSETQLEQFENYYHLLIEWNQKINLTAITDKEDVYLKHFYDSVMPLWLLPDYFSGQVSICDVGAGAGFPSIPMKIIQPQLQVTIVDSLNKRIQFINHLAASLNINGITALHGRAEDIGQNPDYRGQFDIVTARAVAALNVLSEYCLPLVRKGGYFMAMKGQKAQEELLEANKAIKVLGAKYEHSVVDILPKEASEREILIIQKTLDTPKKYPRQAGKPAKKPIQ